MARTKLSGPRDKPKAKKKASVRLTPKAKKAVPRDGDKVAGAEPRKKARRIDKTAAEMAGPRGSGIWDQLTKPFSLVLCHRTIAAAVMRNEQVSARAGLQDERKHVKELLKEKQSGAEYDKLAGRLLHIEDDIRRTKTTEKAAVESLLKLVLESVGGDLFVERPDDENEEKPEKDLPGQLKLGEPDLSPEPAKPLVDIKIAHLDQVEIVDANGAVVATGKFDSFYTKLGEVSLFIGSDTQKFKVAKNNQTVRRVSRREEPAIGERYVFKAKDAATKPAELVGAVIGVMDSGTLSIQPDDGEGAVRVLHRALDEYSWEPAKDAA